jgi:hypothetical protein
MATILIKKRDTTGAPSSGDLTNSTGGAEIAVNTADKRIFAKDSGGTVVEIGTAPSTIDINAGTIDGVTLGTNSAVTEAQIDNININGNTITSTNTDGNIVLDPNGTGSISLAGPVGVADNLVTRPILKDYAVEGSAIGNTGATRTIDMEVANFFSATLDQACTFTFSNPPASGDFGAFVLELTNGGAFAITYPASVDFPGGTAPTLTASGVDQLVFTTRDGGTTYFAFVAGLDIKSP